MRLIDADALKKSFYSGFGGASHAVAAGKLIDAAPTIDPVKYGRWMGTVCSACGSSVSFYFDCDYCPVCGARMDGEEVD